MRASTGATLDQTRPHWRMIGIPVHHGCVCSRISVIIIRFGGECLVERFTLISVVSLTIAAVKQMYRKKQWHPLSTAPSRSGTWTKFMIFSHVRSGVGLTVRLLHHLPPFPLIKNSKRLPGLPTGTRNGHSNAQTIGSWRRDAQIAAGNVHNLSGGETRLG